MPQCKLDGGPVFTFSWGVGKRFASLPLLSYAADQVHLKHEKPQVLLIESHITIGMIQQRPDVASVLCVSRHCSWHAAWPTVRLKSWKLVGILWRYHHESWMKLSLVN